jgi:hypothetical protein
MVWREKEMISEPIILLLSIIVAFVVQNICIITDDREQNGTARDSKFKKYWHAAGGFQHLWVMYVIGRFYGWYWSPVAGSLTWYFMDGLINTYVLRREFWYVGDTAVVDIVQKKIACFLRLDARLLSACLKHAAVIVSFILLILKYR